MISAAFAADMTAPREFNRTVEGECSFLLLLNFTTSMEKGPSWKDTRFLASEEIT